MFERKYQTENIHLILLNDSYSLIGVVLITCESETPILSPRQSNSIYVIVLRSSPESAGFTKSVFFQETRFYLKLKYVDFIVISSFLMRNGRSTDQGVFLSFKYCGKRRTYKAWCYNSEQIKKHHDFLRDNKKVNRLHNMHIYYKV